MNRRTQPKGEAAFASLSRSRKRAMQGVTVTELMLVVAIMGVVSAVAVPSMGDWSENQRLSNTAQTVSSALGYARSQAAKTGSVHIVFFQNDAASSALTVNGETFQVLVLDDGRPGTINQNGARDAGETQTVFRIDNGVNFGVTSAGAKVGVDGGTGTMSTGSTFVDAANNDASWIQFQPNGVPVAMSSGGATGAAGTGSGGIYLTSGSRDKAIVLTPLGATRVYTWDAQASTWKG
jgi:Tfp pilus assembly protein FimT